MIYFDIKRINNIYFFDIITPTITITFREQQTFKTHQIQSDSVLLFIPQTIIHQLKSFHNSSCSHFKVHQEDETTLTITLEFQI